MVAHGSSTFTSGIMDFIYMGTNQDEKVGTSNLFEDGAKAVLGDEAGKGLSTSMDVASIFVDGAGIVGGLGKAGKAGKGMTEFLSTKVTSVQEFLSQQRASLVSRVNSMMDGVKNYQLPNFQNQFALAGGPRLSNTFGDAFTDARDTFSRILGKGDKAGDAGRVASEGSSEITVEWTNHGYKHFPQKNMTWGEIVKSTKNGPAKYKNGIEIEPIERQIWAEGIPVTNGKPWKVQEFDYTIGASNGKETSYMRVEESAGVIHGHPITKEEYKKLLK